LRAQDANIFSPICSWKGTALIAMARPFLFVVRDPQRHLKANERPSRSAIAVLRFFNVSCIFVLRGRRPKIGVSMQQKISSLIAAALIVLLSGCSRSDPGPLAGTWQMAGIVPMKVQFRRGEEESFGIIEQVSYEVSGDAVLVKIESGPMKGTSARYVLTGPDTAQFAMGTLHRVK
jgi:hypothetical protein